MKSTINRIFSIKALVALMIICATGGAWADTLRVLGDDATICSSATSLNQLGIDMTDGKVAGKINFYTPAGCSAGDKLLLKKVEMLESTGNTANAKQEATTITITVGGQSYTSSTVVKSSTAPSSLGNLTTAGIASCKLLTYNFPNEDVFVEAGEQYDVTFNGAGFSQLRCRMESTSSGTVFTAPVNSGWKPYGVITVTPLKSSNPYVGDKILLSNTATSGSLQDSPNAECNFAVTIPATLGLPSGAIISVKKLNFASWNDTMVKSGSSKCDPYGIYLNGQRSYNLKGNTTYSSTDPGTIDLTGAKIQATATTSANRLSFAFVDGYIPQLTVGTTYAQAGGNGDKANSGKGVTFLHYNGNQNSSGSTDYCSVRYVSADSGAISTSTASGYFPVYEMYAEVVSIPAVTATISSAGTYTLADLFTTVCDNVPYVINVNESATLNIDSATTIASLTINVASGKTLTLTGNTLTASEIAFTGDGVAATQNMSMFSGTLTGDGTLCYDMNSGADKPSGIVCTSDDWAGMLWIKNGAYTGWNFNTEGSGYIKYGSANSILRLENVTCYLNATETVGFTLDLHGEGLKITNGNQYKVETVKKLTGSGTLAISGGSSNGDGFIIQDGSEFAGSIDITTGNYVVNFADSGTYADSTTGGKIIVGSGKTATVASGKTWSTTNQNGIEINGTLTLADSTSTLTGAISGSGTLVYNDELPNSADFTANTWTGTVEVNGGTTTAAGIDAADAAQFMNSGSVFTVATGTVKLGTAEGLTGTVNVNSGATLQVEDDSTASLSLAGVNSGTINLQMATALTTLTLGNGIARGTVVYPSSLTTLNVSLTETVADDGEYSVSCGSATPTAATLTLTRPDGTTVEEVAGTIDGSTVSFAWTPAVSGKACWIAYEMEYVSGNASKTGFENTGSDTTALNSDSGIEGDNAFYNGMLYTYAHPWRDMTGDNTYPSSWTAVVRCTVPNYENAAIITFGTRTGGLIGLVAGHDPETEMKLVKTTGDSAFTVLSTMTVQNATTAQHVYVFEVENNSTIKVYCDGEQVLNETYSAFTLGGGIQIGSVHGGVSNTGIVRFAKNESPANTLSETVQKDARIDCVRLFKGLLGPNAIRQLSVEFPAVKLYRATVAADATTTWDALTWSPAWDGGNAYSKIILTAAGNGILTLPESITAEDFKIDVASGHVLTLNRAAGGTTITTTNPMEIDNGTMYLADDTSLGTWEIGGTGTVRLKNGAMVTGALSGTAKVEIPSGTTVGVVNGSIANQITGAGVLAYPLTLPASALSFSSWTGTVQLPPIASSAAINFNNYGTTGSTVYLTSMSGAWIDPNYTAINPKLYLDGNMTLTAMSTRTYTFAEIDGPGNLSFATSGDQPTAININKVAEGYSGTVTNNTMSALVITTLAMDGDTSTAFGTKLLNTNGGNITVTGVTIGGAAQPLTLYYADDGVYVDGKVTSEGEGSSAVTTVDTDTTSVSINLGDGYEGSVVVPPNVASVTTTGTSLATDKVTVKYGATDISGAFTVGGSAGAITLTLNENGSVDGVNVKPEVNTSSDPMTLSGDTPNFTVKTIPGLYYTVLTSDSATSDFVAAGDAVLATGTSTELNTGDDSWGENENVKYYKISVGRTAAEAQQ